MAVMLLGGIVQAIIFGNVAVLIQTLDSGKSHLREKLASLNEIIKLYILPESMAYRIVDSVEYSWNLSQVRYLFHLSLSLCLYEICPFHL